MATDPTKLQTLLNLDDAPNPYNAEELILEAYIPHILAAVCDGLHPDKAYKLFAADSLQHSSTPLSIWLRTSIQRAGAFRTKVLATRMENLYNMAIRTGDLKLAHKIIEGELEADAEEVKVGVRHRNRKEVIETVGTSMVDIVRALTSGVASGSIQRAAIASTLVPQGKQEEAPAPLVLEGTMGDDDDCPM